MTEAPVDLEYVRIRCHECDSGCWEWGGYMRPDHRNSPRIVFRRPDAHGIVRPVGWPVRSLVYLLTKGKRPDARTQAVLPKCENPLCVAPDHLKLVRRGSWSRGKKKTAMQPIRISQTRAKNSKVPEAAVQRFRIAGADLKALAAEFGITLAYAYMLRNRQYRAAAAPTPFAGLGAGR
jgi:hypothetical protein